MQNLTDDSKSFYPLSLGKHKNSCCGILLIICEVNRVLEVLKCKDNNTELHLINLLDYFYLFLTETFSINQLFSAYCSLPT